MRRCLRVGLWLGALVWLAACGSDGEGQTRAAAVLATGEGGAPTETRTPAVSEAAMASATPEVAESATATVHPTVTVTVTVAATAMATAASAPSATATAHPTVTSTATADPTVTATATSTPWAYPPLALTPGEPQGYLERYMLVSFYGAAEGAGMGILNFREPPQLLAELRERVAQYQALAQEREVLPGFHVIVTVADPWFGEDRNFNHHLSLEAVEEWLALAEQEGVAVVLDIQPGHAPVQEEFERIKPYLYHPHVHLALDSEYTMERTPSGLYEIPGEVLGSLYAEQINPIQAQLEEIALEIGVNKVLILHQFEDEMLPDKENIEDFAHVEVVIDSDGFGGPDKVRDYVQYAGEPGFEYGGIKLYRNWDNPLLTPEDVMGLEPRPAVVVYQ